MSGGAVRLGCYLAVTVTCLQPAPPAMADDAEPRVRAQELLDQGNELFRQGDLHRALEVYRGAYDAFASPKLLFNIASCEEGLGERPQSMRDFARFLAEAPEAAANVRAKAEERVRALAGVLTAIEVSAPANLTVGLDGARMGSTPLKAPLWAEPGLHQLTVDRAGQPPWVTTVVGRAGARVSVSVPEPSPAPPRLDPLPPVGERGAAAPKGKRSGGLLSRWWLWTGVGVILVGGAVATYLATRCPASRCE